MSRVSNTDGRLIMSFGGISYLNLNMMTSDAISVLTSFNEEDKPEVLNADDPANAAAILRQFGQLGE